MCQAVRGREAAVGDGNLLQPSPGCGSVQEPQTNGELPPDPAGL